MTQSGIPRDWARKLEAAKKSRQMQGERRVISMLFCDVTGSTSMAEGLDPEVWAEIMNDAFDYLIAPIYRYEGTLARMMGDGLLAFFGAPVAHEDDPQRAILAALDIIKDLEPYRQEINGLFGMDFNVRIGINTGPVVVGEIGSDLAVEYTAMGDAINLASRMEQTAVPGTVQISEYTHRLVAPIFDFESLGEVSVKGRSEPIPTFRPIAAKKSPGRLRGIQGLNTPVVGRDAELSQLNNIIAALAESSGHIVVLTGEAGLGKSRLIAEMKALWQQSNSDPESWTESAAIGYESLKPYSLFLRQVRSALGIAEHDEAGEIREKIARSLTALPEEQRAAFRRAMETLLAVEEANQPIVEAELLKNQLFEAVSAAYELSSSNSGAVHVFDDLHWADPASVELIIHLLGLVLDHPILFILASRPETNSAGWEIVSLADQDYSEFTTRINLAPLLTTDSNLMISNLLAVDQLPPQMRQLILVKSDGNPFFVEELVRELIDIGAIERDESGLRWQAAKNIENIAIPDNLQSLLISRIDRIEKETKRTLQLASVIGRSFMYKILAAVSDAVSEVANQLSVLEEFGLILESSNTLELEYMFRHELTRDAAYRTILHRRRRTYHLQVGQAFEKLMSGRLGEEAHNLAYHFSQAGDNQQALKYSVMAAETAAQLYANREAANYYQQALKIGREIAPVDQLVQVYVGLGRVFEVSSQYDQAIENYQEMNELGKSTQRPKLSLEALMARATIQATYTSHFNPSLAREALHEALEIAKELDDPGAQAKIYWISMLVSIFDDGNNQEAVIKGELSLAIARRHNLEEQLAYTLHDISRAYAMVGRNSEALDALAEAGSLFRMIGNLPMLADNRATLAYGYFAQGDLEKAQDLSLESISVSQESGSLWGEAYGRNQLSLVQFEQGLFKDAADGWRRSQELSRRGNFLGGVFFANLYLGRLYGFLGAYDQGLAFVEEALAAIQENSYRAEEPEALIFKASLLADSGDVSQAVEVLERLDPKNAKAQRSNIIMMQLMAVAQSNVYYAVGDHNKVVDFSEKSTQNLEREGFPLSIPAVLLTQGKAEAALGRLEAAQNTLFRAQEYAEKMGVRRILWAILAARSQIEEQLGNQNSKDLFLSQSKVELAFILSQIDNKHLEDSFVSLPQVQRLI